MGQCGPCGRRIVRDSPYQLFFFFDSPYQLLVGGKQGRNARQCVWPPEAIRPSIHYLHSPAAGRPQSLTHARNPPEAPMPPPPLLPRLSPTPPSVGARDRGSRPLPSPARRRTRPALLAVVRAKGKDEASFTERILDYIEGTYAVQNAEGFV